MARRRSSLLEGLVGLTAMFPWWVGVVLAIVVYVWLHSHAVAELPKPNGMHDVGAAVTAPLVKMLATIGQYLLPVVFLLGAATSYFQRKKRKELLSSVAISSAASSLENMSWREFEILVGEAFRQRGYEVIETGGGGADGGVDLVLKRGAERYFVQCKHWKVFKVGVAVVRELYGVMAAKGAAGGFVVTSGKFTEEAQRFAEGRSIALIAGNELHRMIRDAGPIKPANTLIAPACPPACPKCSSPMVKRQASRGTHAGQSFWGCPAYPKCRGTRDVEP
ncbi:MAG: restriction endonuclease [Pseudomonadota bacterium]